MKRKRPECRRSVAGDYFGHALPFTIQRQGAHGMFAQAPEPFERLYEWTPEQTTIAEAALVVGFHVAVSVPIEGVAQVAAAIGRALRRPLYMRFDTAAEKLVVWIVHDEDESNDGTA